MKKIYWTVGIIVLVVIVVLVLKSSGDSWLVKKGENLDVGENVADEPGSSFLCALELYRQADATGMNFSSQCLGICGDFAVDIVHNPRDDAIDNLIENQCESFRNGEVNHFIELDQEGEIVRIV